MNRGLAIFTAVALLAGAAAPARAQPACARQGDPLHEQGRPHFEAGKKYIREGFKNNDRKLLERAYEEFAAAYKICQTMNGLFNLSKAALATDRPEEAMRLIRQWVRRAGGPPKPSTTDKRAQEEYDDFTAAWDMAFKATAHVEIVADSDALVLVDGVALDGRAPFAEPIDLKPGEHAFEARIGGRSQTEKRAIAAGMTESVKLQLSAAQQAPPPRSPAPRTPQPPPEEPTPAPENGVWPPPTGSFVLAGVSGLALVTGIVFSVVKENNVASMNRTLDANPSVCADRTSALCASYSDNRDTAASAGTWATGMYIATGALLAGAVILAIVQKDRPRAAAWLAPTISPSTLAFGAGGRF